MSEPPIQRLGWDSARRRDDLSSILMKPRPVEQEDCPPLERVEQCEVLHSVFFPVLSLQEER